MKFIKNNSRFAKIMSLALSVVLLLTTLNIGLVPSVFATTDYTPFTVNVTDEDGEAVAGATVAIAPVDEATVIPELSPVITDEEGKAVFEAVYNFFSENSEVTEFEATYTVTAEGYEEASVDEENAVTVTAQGSITVTLTADAPLPEDTKPTIKTVEVNPEEWTNSDVTLKVICEDTDVTEYLCEELGGEWQSEPTFVVEENGKYTFKVKDSAGNESESFSVEVTKIDKDAPEIDDVVIDNNEATNGAVTMTVKASDVGSGVAEYRMDEGDWQAEPEFEVTDSQEHEFYVKDAAGNVSDAKNKTAENYDDEEPVIKDVTYSDEWTNTSVTYTVETEEDKTGIASYGIAVKGTDDIKWQDNAEFVIEDTELYSFFVKDGAGNISGAYDMKEPAKIDKTAPVIGDVTLSNTEWTNQDIDFTVVATDAESGITEYRMDGGEWQAAAVFTIEDSEEHTFEVKDKAGNVSAVFKKTAENFDDVKPVVNKVIPSTAEPTNQTITVTVEASDDKSGIKGYREVENVDGEWKPVSEEWSDSINFEVADKKEHAYQVIDNAGNISVIDAASIYKSTNYDAKAPELSEVVFEQVNGESFAEVLNFLTFGVFFNEKVTVEIVAVDNEDEISNATGIKAYSVYFYDEDGNEVYNQENISENKFSFTVGNFKGTIKVAVSDNAGNVTEKIDVTTQNSNLENFDYLMIENDAPVISQFRPDNKGQKENFDIEFKVSDIVAEKHYSGINTVKVTVNGTEVLLDKLSETETAEKAYTLAVDTAAKTVNGQAVADWKNGELTVKVNAYDNAGNAATECSADLYIDQTVPVIKGFDFDLTDNIEVEKDTAENLYKAVTITDYGFYFKENVKVTVYADDPVGAEEAVASGVKSITYKAVDVEGNVQYSGTADVGENNSVSFDISKDFKGQIYAYATDNAGNAPEVSEGSYEGYEHPNGTIIESTKKHTDTSSIEITAPEKVGTQSNSYSFKYTGEAKSVDKEKAYDDAQLVPLYNTTNINFGVTVTDTYSGIRSIKWTLIKGDSKTVETVNIDNKGELSGDTDGWVADTSSDNLVYSMSAEALTFEDLGDYNDMVLLVELTDRAGNTSYDYYVFGNDTVKPVINVVTPSLGEDEWTNESVTYTIEATDSESGILAYGVILKADKANTENIKWQNTPGIVIEDTQIYSFFVKDRAGNISNSDDMDDNNPANIDKIAPVISDVTLSNTEWTNQPIDFTVVATDEGDSGIVYYIKDGENQISNVFEGIADDEEHYFIAVDKAGNESEKFFKTAENFDDIKPDVNEVSPSTTEPTNQPITITVGASDNKSGIKEYRELLKVDGEWMIKVETEAGEEWKSANDEEGWVTTNTFEVADNKEHAYQVKDKAGNISDIDAASTYKSTNYDAEAPELRGVVFEQVNEESFAKVLNFLTFGVFFNEKVTVEITAEDVEKNVSNATGIKDYSVYLYDEASNEVYKAEYSEGNKFDLDIANFKGTLKVMISDNAGNETGKLDITTANSNLENFDYFMIENDVPVISEIVPANEEILRKDFDFEFTVSDIVAGKHYSGINTVMVTVNGTEVLLDKLYEAEAKTDEKTYALTVNTAAKTVNGQRLENWNKGTLEIKVNAYDNAGNAAAEVSSVAYLDQNSPIIKGFDFSLTENIDVEKDALTNLYGAVIVDDYGFYFKETVRVTIYAEDLIGADETVASGLKSITYKAVDVNGTVKYSGTDVAVNTTNNSISFEIRKEDNFKGQIYAYATDNIGNTPNDCVTCTDDKIVTAGEYKGYSHPNSSIVESIDRHETTSSIEIIAPEQVGTQNNSFSFRYTGEAEIIDAEKAYDDAQLVPLYNTAGNLDFEVNVTDSYSGIRSVKWTLFEDGSAVVEKTVDVNNRGDLSGDSGEWRVSEGLDEDNLVYGLTGQLSITGNHNDMVLFVELTDRAGNTSYDYYVFGIDSVNPKIDVRYDDDKAENDAEFIEYFRTDRTAVITVTERNFRAENIVAVITKDGAAVEIVNLSADGVWTEKVNEANLDETTYTATVNYTVDGDYTFDIAFTDNAGNENEEVNYGDSIAPTKFTVDKTIPTVTVVYSNNSAANGNYYKADRIATITITEHNFVPERVKFLESSPSISGWKSAGDVHTTTITYQADGKYKFDIEMLDKAGNSIEEYTAQEFYIDKTNPEVVISGIGDQSANNDEGSIGFTITATDDNFDVFVPTLSAVVMTDGNFEVKTLNIGRTEDIANGKRYTVSNIEADGVYSISCSVIDKAGNVFTTVTVEDASGKPYAKNCATGDKLVTFSVNRDGSVFTIDEYTEKLIKVYYTQNVTENITLIEINADAITESKVMLNGKELVKDTDYTVTMENGTGTWYKYQYSINKALFANEGEYNVVISSKDKATNEAYSDVKNASVKFVVDRTAPVVTVAGLKTNGRYQIDKQVVTIVPTDDGGALSKLVVRTVDENGNVIAELLNLSGDELLDAVENGEITFELGEGLYQNVQIICEDCAGNVVGAQADEIYSNITISSNAFMIFWANKPARWGTIAGLGLLVAAAIIIIVLKKRKK
ncbi:MAG: carboxypeptidase regulatory-like domain-containing protein [Clostridia bacterium]|nr:carboxypeptidase regulatory-like domain-containing protein [Clostridia bacterium]